MKDIYIDKLFRERVEEINTPPENISWNEEKGWIQYCDQYRPKKTLGKKILIALSVAAATSVIVFLAVFQDTYLKSRNIIVQNQTSGVRQIDLPDGNKIWLNKNSSVEYPPNLNSEYSEIVIRGEVYIEISNLRSEQYILKAANAIVYAGNKSCFNIKAYPGKENTDIAVAAGAVKVMEEGSPGGMALLVTQGNYCSVHKSQKLIYASATSNDNYLAWKTGRLVFEGQSMATVTEILSEFYGTPIEISERSIAYCMFSGSFEKPALNTILNKIQSDLNLEIINTGTKITISGTGCL